MIARPNERLVSRILVGYDGSTAAKRSLSFIDRLGIDKSVHIDLVLVMQDFNLPTATPLAYRRRAKVKAHPSTRNYDGNRKRNLVRIAVQILARRPRLESHVLVGDAARELINRAQGQQGDLIVVESRKPSRARH
jgi:nucleotide-binding universal stress UspA family protein